ncbi:MAG: amidohydrolase/deacetylase family metallohydrolase, partial [Candidatus Tectomicrobia bacterium]|nr:amidohydrolase/deacetylase family metallohydrolase [Candidatus Tectomicrobia bacterium]
MPYDLLLRGGIVVDPSQGIHKQLDVGVAQGKISRLQENIPSAEAAHAIDVSGKYVCPGLIDLHTHLYTGVTTWGIEADPTCLNHGVTTAVDAGSSSWITFPGFQELSIKRSKTRVLCFIHISGIGLTYGPVGEMREISFAAPEETAEIIQEHREVALGVKVRQAAAQVGTNGVEPLRKAVQAAEKANTRVMVHIGAGVPLPDVLALLRPGDIVTHCYQGRGDTIIDEGGTIVAQVNEARRRGIVFDVGHGAGSLKFDVVRAAFEKHFYPDVISTDLHTLCVNGPVFDLPTTMSKFLHFGLSLDDVVEKTTIAPAKAIGREGEMGSLKVGMPADIAVLDLLEGEFEFEDTHGTI